MNLPACTALIAEDEPLLAQALQAVVHAALGFTPAVCTDGATVLLEVQPSLRFFGGAARLAMPSRLPVRRRDRSTGGSFGGVRARKMRPACWAVFSKTRARLACGRAAFTSP